MFFIIKFIYTFHSEKKCLLYKTYVCIYACILINYDILQASKIARGNLRQGAVPQQTNSLGALDKVKVINVRSAPSDATMDDLGDSGDSKNDFCDKITKAGSFS